MVTQSLPPDSRGTRARRLWSGERRRLGAGRRRDAGVPISMRTFVISTMALGGSARALANLANHFAARGDAVQILTLHGGVDAYALHPSIRRRNLGFRSASPPASAESMSAAI